MIRLPPSGFIAIAEALSSSSLPETSLETEEFFKRRVRRSEMWDPLRMCVFMRGHQWQVSRVDGCKRARFFAENGGWEIPVQVFPSREDSGVLQDASVKGLRAFGYGLSVNEEIVVPAIDLTKAIKVL